jgi:hypothetical protein
MSVVLGAAASLMAAFAWRRRVGWYPLGAGMRAKIDFAVSVDHVTELLMSGTEEPLENFLDTLYETARLITQA